ncbi:TetR/AcrR family transcriptional regulator [Thauera linaloolentis]|uniref:TetR family transcriptional regulator n=1 Tax=Thauera linaloolentis (strain DSM 12138 / JCM 21573 / CCUG 41526 / CIP 105981 / IAM 15112 / NBRC 102519 / 47Lol) TaxID=1123367 RepID=N6Y593_THAL4|nr:TetR/AcrR family transcriptional regulator [Thauera linaloolentis]ENO89346.1 TetR family transcriptional regulator [Thauera linaloolentis 47Lol = DSM 12138]MCM8565005.1 TetR/AcrR family transcriptional regulator [Thauera linaloolentis]
MQPQRRTRAEMIEETRAKLVAAARIAFASQGFAHTSMDDFTAAAGLTRGALYHHFGNKEGLLLAVIEQIEAEVGDHLQAVSDAAPSPWEGFRRRCRTYLELALEPEIRRIILQDARAIFGDVPQAAQSVGIAALQTSLDGLIAEGVVAPLHTNVTARMIYGAVTEASFWIAEPEGDQEARLEQALEGLERLLGGLLIH